MFRAGRRDDAWAMVTINWLSRYETGIAEIDAQHVRLFEVVNELIESFRRGDGNLAALVEAAVAFVDARRFRAHTDPPRNASGRVLPATFEKIQKIEDALSGIRGMSRAKVLAGLIQLLIENPKGTTPKT